MHTSAEKTRPGQQTSVNRSPSWARTAVAEASFYSYRQAHLAGEDQAAQSSLADTETAPGHTPADGFDHNFSRISVSAAVPATIPARLTVIPPEDISEQEADRVAYQVIQEATPQRPRTSTDGGERSNRQIKQLVRPHGQLQTAPFAAKAAHATTVPPGVLDSLRAAGQPLDVGTRTFMESRFGNDFSRVRIHTDARAEQAALAINARAFTVGNHIVFNRGEFNVGHQTGRQLLAHELTHTLQQTGGVALQRAPVPAPALPGPQGPIYVPPLQPRVTTIPVSDICPSCTCQTDAITKIEQARNQTVSLFTHAATQLQTAKADMTPLVEKMFGEGSATPENITYVIETLQGAATFLQKSAVDKNIICDDANQTVDCQRDANAFYDRGYVVICSQQKNVNKMLYPPKVETEVKSTVGFTEGESVPHVDVRQTNQQTKEKQERSDAMMSARLTAILAHEAIHQQLSPSIIDIYRDERLYRFLGARNQSRVNLTPMALHNPDSLVSFALQSLQVGSGEKIVPQSEAALTSSEELSGPLSVRPLRGRKDAKVAITLAQEALEQTEESIAMLLFQVQGVQATPAQQGSQQYRPTVWTDFPEPSQKTVQLLTAVGGESVFANPDAKAIQRLQVILEGVGGVNKEMKEMRTVIARRFIWHKPDKRFEIAIPDWREFREMAIEEQIPYLLRKILQRNRSVANLTGFVWEHAQTYGGFEKIGEVPKRTKK